MPNTKLVFTTVSLNSTVLTQVIPFEAHLNIPEIGAKILVNGSKYLVVELTRSYGEGGNAIHVGLD